jgi:hypothetical protein
VETLGTHKDGNTEHNVETLRTHKDGNTEHNPYSLCVGTFLAALIAVGDSISPVAHRLARGPPWHSCPKANMQCLTYNLYSGDMLHLETLCGHSVSLVRSAQYSTWLSHRAQDKVLYIPNSRRYVQVCKRTIKARIPFIAHVCVSARWISSRGQITQTNRCALTQDQSCYSCSEAAAHSLGTTRTHMLLLKSHLTCTSSNVTILLQHYPQASTRLPIPCCPSLYQPSCTRQTRLLVVQLHSYSHRSCQWAEAQTRSEHKGAMAQKGRTSTPALHSG